MSEIVNMDSLDEQLVRLLEENARQSSKAVAEHLSVSAATIRRRTRKLIESGVIRIVARANPTKAGIPLVTVIAFDFEHEKLGEALKTLANQPEITWVSSTTGRFDILALAHFHSTTELADFVQRRLPTIRGLRNSETFICLEIRKGLYMQM